MGRSGTAREPSASSPAASGPSVGGEALLILAARVFGAVSAAVVVVVLTRGLGNEGYGLYVWALSIVTLVTSLADLGVPHAAARFIAEQYPDGGRMAAVFRTALRVKLAMSLPVALGLVLLAPVLADQLGDPRLTPVLRVAGGILVLHDLFGLLTQSMQSRRSSRSQVTMALAKSSVELTAMALLVLGSGLGAAGAMFGSVLGFLAGAALGLRGLLAVRPTAGGDTISTRALVRYGREVWFANVAWVAFANINPILVGTVLGAASAGVYAAPLRFAGFVQFGGLALAGAVSPRLAKLERAAAAALFLRVLRALLAVYVMIAIVTVPVADELMGTLLGDGFAESGDVLLVVLPYMALFGVAPLVSIALNYLGAAGSRKYISYAAVAVNAGLGLLLIGPLDILGPAVAADIAFALYVGGHLLLCRRVLPFALRPLVRSSVVAVAAGALGALVAWGVGSALGSGGLGSLTAYLVGLAAGGAVLVALRELDRGLVRALRR